jgi:transposase
MSMKPQDLSPIPEETYRIARQAFPNGMLAMEIRESLGPIYSDEPFAHLFPKRGRGAEAPWRLALVTVLQTMENLTDRQAAQQVSGRIDWKYALSLPLEEASFDYSIRSVPLPDVRTCGQNLPTESFIASHRRFIGPRGMFPLSGLFCQ